MLWGILLHASVFMVYSLQWVVGVSRVARVTQRRMFLSSFSFVHRPASLWFWTGSERLNYTPSGEQHKTARHKDGNLSRCPFFKDQTFVWRGKKNVVQCTRYFKSLATRDTFDTEVRMPQIWDTPASSRLITTTDTEVSRVASFKPGKTLTGWIPFCTFCAIFALAALLLAAEQTEE